MVYSMIFFDFLRFCIGATSEIPEPVNDADWGVLYAIAKKQALIGVLFHGIQQLPKDLAPDEDLLMTWMGMAQRIKQQNMRLFMDSVKVYKNFKDAGFRNCILKGQGHALLYPNPFMRTPGDIDIYLEGGRKRIMEYVDKVCPNQVMRYHHVDFPVMKTPIEVHFTPSYMFCPWHNRRMQKWFGKVMDLQCGNVVTLPDGYGEIAVPTTSFNVVYVLSHLYRHVFTEGIGLRQLLDYYFVIEKFWISNQSFENDNFPTTPSLLHKEGSTSHPSPLSSEERDVAGDAIALPEFLYRQRSLCPQGVADECFTQQSYQDDFRLHSAIIKQAYDCSRLHENCDCLCGVNRLAERAADTLAALQRDLKWLGLWKFAGAVMYVLHEVFGLEEEKMIAPMNEKEGAFLLDEIMLGGNFGQYDDRLGDKTGEGKVHRYFRMSLRNMRFVKHYPSEAICEPLFRTWFFFWKRINAIK